jgi:hypothetical protein
MGKEITEILQEKAKDILTTDTLDAIKLAVEQKQQVAVSSALDKQDEDYANKLQQVLEALDRDHTNKLKRVVKTIDADNAAKLQTVVARYSGIVNEQASAFKDDMIDKVSDYLDVYLEKSVPQKAINEAVKNRKALSILESLRGTLAIDTALMKQSIKSAVLDGKTQITESNKELEVARNEAKVLKENLAKTQAALIIEQKTVGLNDKKKAYAKRVLEGKSPKFILENIDYTLSLFDKKEDERLVTLREEANSNRKTGNDPVVVEEEVITEDVQQVSNPLANIYMEELSRY